MAFDPMKFRARREAARLGQGRVCLAMAMHQSSLARMETPRRSPNPTADTLARFAALYGCEIGDFFTETEEERALRQRGREMGSTRPARGPKVRRTLTLDGAAMTTNT